MIVSWISADVVPMDGQPGSDAGDFALDFGIEIDGTRMPLLPILVRLLDRGAGRVDSRLVGLVGLQGVVELLLADRALLGERRVARHVELGLDEHRLRLRQVAHRLVERRLELARVDLEQ